MPVPTGAEVWRDYNTNGVSSTGAHEPEKREIRAWASQVEAALGLASASAGLVYPSRSSLYADLAHPANTSAWVLGDAATAYNGVYQKSGSSGAGSWSRVADLPYSTIAAVDAGTGTANAIQATSSIPVSSSAIVRLTVGTTNTASPVSVSFNGGEALTIKTNTGNDVATGGLVTGMVLIGFVSGATFRIVSDQVSSAIVAQAEAAEAAAVAAAAIATGAVAGIQSVTRQTPAAPLLEKLRRGVENATILILGDSTGYDTCPAGGSAINDPPHAWPRLLATALASAYPSYRVEHKTWGTVGAGQTAWSTGDGATTVVQAGPGGAPVLTLYDGSVPGTEPLYWHGYRWPLMTAAPTPDLAVISYGHNIYGLGDVYGAQFEAAYLSLVENLRDRWGSIQILSILQNWGTNNPNDKKKVRSRIARLAADRGMGLFDMGEVIEAAGSGGTGGNASTALVGDGTHLTIDGQSVVASSMVDKVFTWSLYNSPVVPSISSLQESSAELIADNYLWFQPDDTVARGRWYRTVAGTYTTAVDTTKFAFEFPDTYTDAASMRFDASGAGEERLRQFIQIPPLFRGREVTLTACVFRPLANAQPNRGQLILTDVGGQTVSPQWPAYVGGSTRDYHTGVDEWAIYHVTRKIDAAADYVIADLYLSADNSAPAQKTYVQWMSLSLGKLPRRPPPPPNRQTTARAIRRQMQQAVPSSGDTVTIAADTDLMLLRHGSTIAALTIVLPSSPRDGQMITITSASAVTSLAVNPGSNTIVVPVTALAAGGRIEWYYYAAATRWYPA